MAAASIALNRFGLGGRPGDDVPADPKRWLLAQFDRFDPRPAAIAAVPTHDKAAADVSAYFEEQRQSRRNMTQAPGQAPPVAVPAAAMPVRAAPAASMAPANPPMAGGQRREPVTDGQRFAVDQIRKYYDVAVGARTQVAIETPAPFIERLVHFWANHFAVSADKLSVTGLSAMLEFEAVRPHVLGKFADMLHAVERHPAMLLYLDQVLSVGPNSQVNRNPTPGARPFGLNENLAREILELHTLGVRSVYSQADVTELARAMTGWTAAGLVQGAGARLIGAQGTPGSFAFVERIHEPGTRTILGKQWTQQGEAQAAAVLDMLARHPATARHLATKLAVHFAGDQPPPALVARLEQAWLKSDGDLPTLYRALIEAPECWVDRPVKFKTPWEWTVSALRVVRPEPLQPAAVSGLLTQLGQPAWKPGSPAGWDDSKASWLGPDAVMRRLEAAERLAQQSRDRIDAWAIAPKLFPAALSNESAQAIARAETASQGLAIMLVAPEFMRR